ncbi:protein SGT1 homolog isoform X1 [Piliocolobus tephrosceles]|uniref:protein SGT1 homolog isoform X1 n=1 Tax=Piliocolobus tephrosceles TaxID=591936 RepID=UPI000E6AEA89|nr:protein SGT1 homolog isoform X1 [Piliocolobus tephrosceles]
MNLKIKKTVMKEKEIRYDWVQTDSTLSFTLYKKNTERDKFLYYIKKNYIYIIINISDTEIYKLETYLFGEVYPSNTKINISPFKIEIVFEKKLKEQHWTSFKSNEQGLISENQKGIPSPFSRRSIKEWDSITQVK